MMNRSKPVTCRLLCIVFLIFGLANPTARAADEFASLFNGKDFSGWQGKADFWSIEDGVIVGETTKEKPTKGNTFLVWQGGEVSDFVFKAKVRFKGNNSGVQYRSELIDPENYVVRGYQADLHPSPDFFGMLYAEKWRGIVARRFQKVAVGADGKSKVVGEVGDRNQKLVDWQWNELTIIAVGDRQIHQVNGVTTMDLTDNHPQAKRSGILALQLHAGPAMRVEFKDIQLKKVDGKPAKALIEAVDKAQANRKPLNRNTKQSSAGKQSAGKIDWVSQKKTPRWIWRKNNATSQVPLFLQQRFSIDDAVKSAQLYYTCDNGASVWINGKSAGTCSDWMYPVFKADVTDLLNDGGNLVSVQAANKGGVAAFVFKLRIETTNGKVIDVVSDSSWQLADQVDKGWNQTGFAKEAGTPINEIGEFGRGPWGKPGDTNSGRGGQSSGGGFDVNEITVADGFALDLVYEVPKATEGSWVSLTTDPQGRLYASDQGNAGLYRVTVSGTDEKPKAAVEKMPVDVSGAQGMVWHDDALYFNRSATPLYRLTDTTGDGKLDNAEQLSASRGGGEHGNHAVIVAEDGKHLYVDAGNHTDLPTESTISGSRVPTWDEDLLLPREWDANGHARGRLAPGGWVTKFDPQTKQHEVISIGYRNQYDITLNRAGDLFTYDADMEWDLGSPWYRPTRINHVVSGSDYGWRSGSGKWPQYYEDSLPAVVNIGPGSPTGVVSGQGSKFPAKYQDAVFALDWTFGVIYAIHLQPDGAGWKGTQEAFCYGAPLPVTDAIVGRDGHLYFTVGGRGTQSALMRIRYVGNEPTAPVSEEIAGEDARQLRRQLEAFHGKTHPEAIETAWPHLSSNDRWLRHAARIAVESQPTTQWADRVFGETNTQARIAATVALARHGSKKHRTSQIGALLDLNADELSRDQLLGLLRAYALTFVRLGEPTEPQRQRVIAELDRHFPHADKDVNTEMVRVLVHLKSPTVIEKTIALLAGAENVQPPAWAEGIDFERNPRYGSRIRAMLENQPPSHEINYAFMLRNLRDGWTMDQRRKYIEFINRAAGFSGGNSYGKFLANVRDEVLGHLSNADRAALADISNEDFNPVPKFEITPPTGPGQKWTEETASKHTSGGLLRNAVFESGRNLFHAIQCASCHRFDGLGGDVGPDLTTVKNKFDANYMLESIIKPSKVISDQYSSKVVLLDDGRAVTGLMIERDDQVEIYPIRKTAGELKPIVVDVDQIELVKDSAVSQMPAGMLDTLSGDEVRDLIAYLLSGGDPKARVYGR